MDQNTFLYTMPQWFIFASVIALAYGWVEKKRIFTMIGFGILIALGIFAAYAIAKGYFVYHNFLSPEEIMSEEMNGEVLEEMPLEGRILPAYWLFITSGVAAIPGLLLTLKKKKHATTMMYVAGLIALGGFFIIVGAIGE